MKNQQHVFGRWNFDDATFKVSLAGSAFGRKINHRTQQVSKPLPSVIQALCRLGALLGWFQRGYLECSIRLYLSVGLVF